MNLFFILSLKNDYLIKFSKKINDKNLNKRISFKINSINRLLSGEERAQQLKIRSNYIHITITTFFGQNPYI